MTSRRPLPLPPTCPLITYAAASVDALREDVMHSSWFVEFQRDLRTSLFRTVQVRKHFKDPELPGSCLWPC